MLNTEAGRDKACWVRVLDLKPVQGRVKPGSRESSCLGRQTGWDGGPKMEGPQRATPHDPSTLLLAGCWWALSAHSPGPVDSGLPFARAASSSPSSGWEVRLGLGESEGREKHCHQPDDSSMEGHPATEWELPSSPDYSAPYPAHGSQGPDAALGDSRNACPTGFPVQWRRGTWTVTIQNDQSCDNWAWEHKGSVKALEE